mmetsp:Transcript_49492/g.120816  ORF Transcript_49492/g.120816 Transcript_49492/m.120816 type:complete len:241 (-) Transcript_49492:88-810(-)
MMPYPLEHHGAARARRARRRVQPPRVGARDHAVLGPVHYQDRARDVRHHILHRKHVDELRGEQGRHYPRVLPHHVLDAGVRADEDEAPTLPLGRDLDCRPRPNGSPEKEHLAGVPAQRVDCELIRTLDIVVDRHFVRPPLRHAVPRVLGDEHVAAQRVAQPVPRLVQHAQILPVGVAVDDKGGGWLVKEGVRPAVRHPRAQPGQECAGHEHALAVSDAHELAGERGPGVAALGRREEEAV